MYDIIGDIHGYSKTLKTLLEKLGYVNNHGFYSHDERKAIFVGDFVDRGPSIRETLQIVKPMIENEAAMAIMGNHEYNAICFNTKSNGDKNYLRPHSKKNISQHKETLDAFLTYENEWQENVKWFLTLPLFIELKDIRIVHACWDESTIAYLKTRLNNAVMDANFLHRSAIPGSAEYKAIETVLKGYEAYLPPGFHYRDRDGNTRTKIRVRWWKSFKSETYKSLSLSNDNALPDIKVPASKLGKFSSYTIEKKPVFFGHYWNTGPVELLKPNVCCVDYSIAKCEKLVAYRWNGEKVLSNSNFVGQECIDL